MLGADVGTTVVAQVLSFDVSWLSPILIGGGLIVFYATARKRPRNLGRILLGLGLMLLALRLIVESSAPMRASETVGTILSALAGEPVLAVLVAALLTWLAHSSLATVLLIVSLTTSGVTSLPLAFALILRANLGGTLPALLATLNGAPAGRRVAVGNAVFKLLGVVLLLPFLGEVMHWMPEIQSDAARQIVNFHTAFNIALAVVFIGFTGVAGRLMERLFPDTVAVDDAAVPRYLDASVINEPMVALATAARETLRMGDTLQIMLRDVIEVFRQGEKSRISDIAQMDDTVDELHKAIKLYLTDVSREPLDEKESGRCADIMSFNTNLEHIGDIIDKNLLELARRLLAEKVHFRDAERQAAEGHHDRLRHGLRESSESSSLHLDILRDLKRINSHLTSVAYPILEPAGEMRASRLRKPKRKKRRQSAD